jgi:hypothetical protein
MVADATYLAADVTSAVADATYLVADAASAVADVTYLVADAASAVADVTYLVADAAYFRAVGCELEFEGLARRCAGGVVNGELPIAG